MTRNALKIIACASMLIDHIGYFLFPEIGELRYIGRLAMPIFAFFIGEGCLYTRDRKKYFTRIFSLGVFCQLFYVGEWLVNKSTNPLYLNILFTFSASVLLCSAFILSTTGEDKSKKRRYSFIFGGLLILFALICYLGERGATDLSFDYGFGGIILPVFAAVTKERKKKFFIFAAGLLLCVLSFNYSDIMWTVCALLSLVPLAFYNGKSGEKNLQKAFYLFYPGHLAAIYLASFFL